VKSKKIGQDNQNAGQATAQEGYPDYIESSLLRTTLESTADGILVVDRAGKIVTFNQKFRKMWHIPENLMNTGNDDDALRHVLQQLKDPEGFFQKVMHLYANPELDCFDEFEFADGRIFERYSIPQRMGKDIIGRVFSFRDVTQRKQMEEKLIHQATRDSLTDLPNRILLEDRIGQAIKISKRQKTKVAILFIDLDRFKLVNDSLGHNIGDTLLKTVAERLKGCLRETDTIARWGGDEFIIVLPDLGYREECIPIINLCQESLESIFSIDNHSINVTSSVGVSFFPDDGASTTALLKNADAAMYNAKSNGRNNFCFYKAQMNEKAIEQLELGSDLHRALEDIINSQLTLNDITLFIPSSLLTDSLLNFSDFGKVVPVDNYSLDQEVMTLAKNELQSHAYRGIIASHEVDLLRAAQLRDIGHLPGQSYKSANAFRQKTIMKKLLKEKGIAVPAFKSVKTEQDILDFMKDHPLPLVIKPDYGTGSDGIKILKSKEEVNFYIKNKLPSLLSRNIELEIETFVEGTMYHINGFYTKEGDSYYWPSVYPQQSICMMEGKFASSYLLSAENPLVPRLNAYAKKVLEALPTPSSTAFHLEVFLTPDDELIFCEIASRIGGKGVRRSWMESFNISLSQLFVKGQVNFPHDSASIPKLSPQKLTGEIWFPVREGRLQNLEKECPLPGVKSYHTFFKTGDMISAQAQNIEECLCGVSLLTAKTEDEMQQRLDTVAKWVNETTQWEPLR